MKILVTGGSSLPGFRAVKEALEKGHHILAVHKENPIPLQNEKLRSIRLDITDQPALRRLLTDKKPDAILHMAALGDVDLCEKDKALAWRTNVTATMDLVSLFSSWKPFLLYLSTDYVFDGDKGGYSEIDPPNPVDYYGLTKLMGEVICSSAMSECAVVRASSIYGLGPGRTNFAKFLIEKLSKREEVRALVDQYTSPSHATDLAKAMVEITEKKLKGIFHITGGRMSRYEFAVGLAEELGFDKSLIKQASMSEMKWFAERPRDSSLTSEATRKRLNTDFSMEKAFDTLREEYMTER
jgi:dTDP-4-dehydrorhamnose reductase